MCRFLVRVAMLLVLCAPSGLSSAQADRHDVLIYQLYENSGQSASLMMWNPVTGAHTLLLDGREVGVSDYVMSHDSGRIAYRSSRDGAQDVYVIDVRAERPEPLNISQSPETSEHIIAWSRDGQSLVFVELIDEAAQKLYLWNGETVRNITPDNMNVSLIPNAEIWSKDGDYLAFTAYDAAGNGRLYLWDGAEYLDITPNDLRANPVGYATAWGYDGRLAITVWYRWSDYMETGSSDIYLWTDHSLTRVPNPAPYAEYTVIGWSRAGQLAVRAREGYEGDIFVWDGVSTDMDTPDITTFDNIAPELTKASTGARWAMDGFLTFVAEPLEDSFDQIYAWDGEKVSNISLNPGYSNIGQTWSHDGRWAFQTLFSREQLVYVRDPNNETILVTEGRVPMWSDDGLLAFCRDIRLLVWDGQNTKTIASADFAVNAYWLNGSSAVCSNG